MCDFFFSFQVSFFFFFFLSALWGFPMKKWEKEENLSGEERWEEEENERKFTMREREREREKSVQKRIETNNKIGLFFFSNIVWIVEIIIKRI